METNRREFFTCGGAAAAAALFATRIEASAATPSRSVSRNGTKDFIYESAEWNGTTRLQFRRTRRMMMVVATNEGARA